jgi:hypothetical protein
MVSFPKALDLFGCHLSHIALDEPSPYVFAVGVLTGIVEINASLDRNTGIKQPLGQSARSAEQVHC